MQTFLQLVAQDLYQKIGNDLSRVAIVFPNKRASLFFNEYLAMQSDRPIWSPAYVSISELFRQLSPWKSGDPIRLVCELYKVFREETRSEETLDDFYFWGELLISDFDDVDKNLVDADRLFSNLQDLKNIMDDYDFLDSEQEEAIRQFFQNFSIERRTQLKEKFISLWDKLGDIYHHYRHNLAELGIAYEGMMYRYVMEELQPDKLKYEHYVFVGFNVLNKVETKFFERLREAGKALFYWDYDIFYTRLPRENTPPYTHEAGEFILRNLKIFPNELPEAVFDTLRKPKNVRFISAPTENAQARYLPEWIRSVTKRDLPETPVKEKENAVVLCNEALLLPVLHSIPSEVKNVNITMGFPLAQTPVYSFVSALIELQTTGYRRDTGRYQYEAVQSVLKHPYTRQLSTSAEGLEKQLTRDNRFFPLPSELKQDTFLEQIFTPKTGISALCQYLTEMLREVAVLYRKEQETDDIFNQLYRESLFKSYTLINRLLNLIDNGELNIQIETLRRLLCRLLATSNIPFHGEPAIGMQVMGVLETRNLDFRNLIMLSLNEGQLPKAGGDSSFIPYNLRKAFGMTTIEHKNAVYAYYFYRLIQRAENVTLLYNTASEGLNRGEMSRFMLQFLVESPHTISREYLEAGQSPQSGREISVEKTPEIITRMYERYDVNRHPRSLFSPSALNTYLDCRLKFYYRYVAGLKAPDEVSAEIDSALFGTIFHRAAELVYKDLTANGKEIRKDDLEQVLSNDIKLQNYVDTAFKEEFFHVALTEKPEYNGTQLINAKVITSYLRQLLRNDLQYAPFFMEGMEKKVTEIIEIETPQGKLALNIGGTIDRIDSKDDTLRIVDYKTGGSPKTPENIKQLFTPADGRPNYIFQTFLYASIMCRKQSLKVAPSLLYIHRAASETYSPVIEMGEARQPKIPVNNFAFYEDEFRERLQTLLQEIYNPEEAFTQTEDTKKCEFCDFRELCRR
ncbi:PD-(D/E)XK nuclease family protein [Bacteroides intestinalis]|jgi:CRISPR/Cas system-associated exonuclease Cas4 (RecB family)|uniref:PD-(D/E)XK nuclease family protein n=1 Tax=Bacteroides intestinalis TaxID=329854 RepID=A0A414L1R5_9BACE|nr:PD-(D/E)XK nuclease family protein [Bacteroides intestinalis]RHE88597.1 PD-(D/E)XK nuclease family protein [Bacteroides intestinalis]